MAMNIRDLRKDDYRTLDGQSLALLISSNFEVKRSWTFDTSNKPRHAVGELLLKKKLKNNNSISLELEFP